MTVTQLYPLINTITQETLGDSVVVNEDLSNIADVGDSILGAIGVDNYVKALVDRIGKVIFVSRVYAGSVPSVMRSDWDFGSIMQKIDCEMPDAIQVNDTWDLQSGASYDPFVFRGAQISAKFFNEKVTFEVDISIAKRQVEESFVNAQQLNTFVEMIYTAVENSMTIKIDGLIMRGLNTMIAETIQEFELYLLILIICHSIIHHHFHLLPVSRQSICLNLIMTDLVHHLHRPIA